MDATQKKSLELLQKYFDENSREFIKEEIKNISNINIEGVSFDQYIKTFSNNYNFDIENIVSVENSKWTTVFASSISETISEVHSKPIIYSNETELDTAFNEQPDLNYAA